MQLGDLPTTSVNFPCDQKILCQLLSTFHATRRPSANVYQLCVRPEEFQSTFREAEDLPSNSVHFPCSQKTFHRLLSTFGVAGRPFFNFRQHSLRPGDLMSTSMNFCAAEGPSINFCQHSVLPGDLSSTSVNIPFHWETFSKLLSTFVQLGDLPTTSFNFLPAGRIYINSPCGQETFSLLLQLSVWPGDLPSTTVKFL